ncbi:MAG: hypothetical protein PHP20_00050 [Firmicutes bacterium]|jgi:hypothetical protein|nr:hypothetical protein [Bacillota bacterium]MDD4336829.1 hypothetical protein [Bacillota bacterium]MDD4791449.1 hypothetical protein [Bacillota bacterium]
MRIRRLLALVAPAVMLTVAALSLAGCGPKKDVVVTPQTFIFDCEAKKAAAQAREEVDRQQRTIPAGIMVSVRLLDALNSATSIVGETFRIEVLEDIIIDGAVVVPAGSPGVGKVTLAVPAKSMGRAGELRLSMNAIYTYDDIPVLVEANEQTAARDVELAGKSFLAYVFLGPVGLLTLLQKGQNVVIPADSQFSVMVRMPVTVMGRVY